VFARDWLLRCRVAVDVVQSLSLCGEAGMDCLSVRLVLRGLGDTEMDRPSILLLPCGIQKFGCLQRRRVGEVETSYPWWRSVVAVVGINFPF
jgi:hypothetical protein